MTIQKFNITKTYKKFLRIETTYNKYLIIFDENKGTGVYMDFEGKQQDLLIKSYKGIKPISAINYLYKKEMF